MDEHDVKLQRRLAESILSRGVEMQPTAVLEPFQ